MKRFIYLFPIILLLGCDLVVDVDVPFDHKSLTLNSFFNPDSVWKVNVTLNRFILDDKPFQSVDDATVVISDENGPITTLEHVGPGLYKSTDQKPTVGKIYSIAVESPSYGTVTSQSFIPAPVVLSDFAVTESYSDDELRTTIKIKIHDDGSQENFYEVSLFSISEHYNVFNNSVEQFRNQYGLESTDPAINNQNNGGGSSILIKDVLFNGKVTELSFKTYGYLIQQGNFVFEVKSVSKDYYDFVSTANLQDQTSGDPFAQPVNVYDNVENGFGIFAGYSRSVVEGGGAKPVIHSIDPMQGKPGDIVTITGENLAIENRYITILFKLSQSYSYFQPIQQSPTQLKVAVPTGAQTGRIIVQTSGGVAFSEEFQVNN